MTAEESKDYMAKTEVHQLFEVRRLRRENIFKLSYAVREIVVETIVCDDQAFVIGLLLEIYFPIIAVQSV